MNDYGEDCLKVPPAYCTNYFRCEFDLNLSAW